MSSFGKLIRFRAVNGTIYYGEVRDQTHVTWESLLGIKVPVYEGKAPWDKAFRLTNRKEEVAEVLSPLQSTPIFRCIGVNYRDHSTEAEIPTAKYPALFMKPSGALAGPFYDIAIHPECLEMDYEAELCVIIGRDCKNLGADEDALDYVLGYTAGNDVSSRWWQWPERSANQAGYAKSFDKFAPIGPVIASSSVIPDPHILAIRSVINGEVRQDASTADLIFNVPTILRFLSRGTTLGVGTVIMTGTPSGVGAFRKPSLWLNDGDIVEVEIEGIGQIRNKMVFEK